MKDKKILIILVITGLLILMTAGYAAFSTTLKINGTGTISSTWKVEFDTTTTNTKCTVTSKDTGKPTTCTLGTLTASNIAAAIAWGSPGDVVTITARVLNKGTLNANVNMSAKMALTSSATTACTNTTTTANYTSYNASGTASSGTAKTINATAQTVGPVSILSHATYNYGIYTITITYNAAATAAAGACTFTGTLTATQAV